MTQERTVVYENNEIHYLLEQWPYLTRYLEDAGAEAGKKSQSAGS